jgi:phosphinothricin acetyltransferase
VAEASGELVGYAYAGKHRARAAYQWSVESSVFVRADARGGGHATALYEALFRLLGVQGFRRCYAGITRPNPASVALHERMGFTSLGVFRRIGFKHGRWHDVEWFEMDLGGVEDSDSSPSPPTLLRALHDGAQGVYGMSVEDVEARLRAARDVSASG